MIGRLRKNIPFTIKSKKITFNVRVQVSTYTQKYKKIKTKIKIVIFAVTSRRASRRHVTCLGHLLFWMTTTSDGGSVQYRIDNKVPIEHKGKTSNAGANATSKQRKKMNE